MSFEIKMRANDGISAWQAGRELMRKSPYLPHGLEFDLADGDDETGIFKLVVLSGTKEEMLKWLGDAQLSTVIE